MGGQAGLGLSPLVLGLSLSTSPREAGGTLGAVRVMGSSQALVRRS